MSPSASSPHSNYRPDIDGLRCFAVLSVIAFHAAPDWIGGGFVGVDIFFVISGFLISSIIFRDLQGNNFSLTEFYIRRIRRIFPALIFVLATTFILSWYLLLADEFAQLGKHMRAGALFVSNLLLWQETGYFDVAAETKPLLHLWSLGIEEQFYIFWPLLLILAHKRRISLFAITLLLSVVSFTLNIHGIERNSVAAFYAPYTRFWELLCGSLLAWFSLHPPRWLSRGQTTLHEGTELAALNRPPLDKEKIWGNLQAVAGALLLVGSLLVIRPEHDFPGIWALVPVLGTLLMIAAGPESWLNSNVLSHRWAIGVGLISFPLYLWHWPLLSLTRIMEGGLPRADIRAGAVILAFILAWFTYHFIERPVRTAGYVRLKTGILCLLMILVGLLGHATYKQKGFTFRLSEHPPQALLEEITEVTRTLHSDGSCYELLKFPMTGSTVCLANSSRPEVLIIGDSHAMALNSAALLGRTSVKTLLLGRHGCPPLMEYSVQVEKKNLGCNDLSQQALQVLGLYPSIRTVVVTSRGPFYFSGQGYGIEGRSGYSLFALDGHQASQTEMFRRGTALFVHALLQLRQDVVYVIDPPELGEDPKACIVKRPVTLAGKNLSNCSQDASKVATRQAQYRSLLEQIRSGAPQLKIYDPLDLFCDRALCYGLREGKLLYRDDDHISFSASDMVLRDMRLQGFLP